MNDALRRIDQWQHDILELRLIAYREDLADWFNDVLAPDPAVTEDNLLAMLGTGVLLCQLATLVDDQQVQWQYATAKQAPTGMRVPCRADAQPTTFEARANVAMFLRWCTALGVPDVLLFETDDLVLKKNEKQVLYCLLDVTRTQTAFRPASIMVAELDVQNRLQGLSLMRPALSHTTLNVLLTTLKRDTVGASDALGRFEIVRDCPVFVKTCGGLVMVRTNHNEWTPLTTYLAEIDVLAGRPCAPQAALRESIRADKLLSRHVRADMTCSPRDSPLLDDSFVLVGRRPSTASSVGVFESDVEVSPPVSPSAATVAAVQPSGQSNGWSALLGSRSVQKSTYSNERTSTPPATEIPSKRFVRQQHSVQRILGGAVGPLDLTPPPTVDDGTGTLQTGKVAQLHSRADSPGVRPHQQQRVTPTESFLQPPPTPPPMPQHTMPTLKSARLVQLNGADPSPVLSEVALPLFWDAPAVAQRALQTHRSQDETLGVLPVSPGPQHLAQAVFDLSSQKLGCSAAAASPASERGLPVTAATHEPPHRATGPSITAESLVSVAPRHHIVKDVLPASSHLATASPVHVVPVAPVVPRAVVASLASAATLAPPHRAIKPEIAAESLVSMATHTAASPASERGLPVTAATHEPPHRATAPENVAEPVTLGGPRHRGAVLSSSPTSALPHHATSSPIIAKLVAPVAPRHRSATAASLASASTHEPPRYSAATEPSITAKPVVPVAPRERYAAPASPASERGLPVTTTTHKPPPQYATAPIPAVHIVSSTTATAATTKIDDRQPCNLKAAFQVERLVTPATQRRLQRLASPAAFESDLRSVVSKTTETVTDQFAPSTRPHATAHAHAPSQPAIAAKLDFQPQQQQEHVTVARKPGRPVGPPPPPPTASGTKIAQMPAPDIFPPFVFSAPVSLPSLRVAPSAPLNSAVKRASQRLEIATETTAGLQQSAHVAATPLAFSRTPLQPTEPTAVFPAREPMVRVPSEIRAATQHDARSRLVFDTPAVIGVHVPSPAPHFARVPPGGLRPFRSQVTQRRLTFLDCDEQDPAGDKLFARHESDATRPELSLPLHPASSLTRQALRTEPLLGVSPPVHLLHPRVRTVPPRKETRDMATSFDFEPSSLVSLPLGSPKRRLRATMEETDNTTTTTTTTTTAACAYPPHSGQDPRLRRQQGMDSWQAPLLPLLPPPPPPPPPPNTRYAQYEYRRLHSVPLPIATPVHAGMKTAAEFVDRIAHEKTSVRISLKRIRADRLPSFLQNLPADRVEHLPNGVVRVTTTSARLMAPTTRSGAD